MDLFDWAAVIAILITGASAVVSAALDTEYKPDKGKQARVIKQLNRAGWAAVILALASTAVSLALNLRQIDDKKRADAGRRKAEEHAKNVELQLGLANKELGLANKEVQRLVKFSERQEKASMQAAEAFDEEAKRAQSRWVTADQRAHQATIRLLDEQSRSKDTITKAQEVASKAIRDQQAIHQQELRDQQDLALISLLGQTTEKPQALILFRFGLTLPEDQFPHGAGFKGGALSNLLLEQARTALVQENCALNIDANFVSLQPRVPDPFAEVVPYGWNAWFCWLDNDFTGLAVAGPQELIPPRPSLDVVSREAGAPLQAEIRAHLEKGISAATLYASSLRMGATVVEIKAKLNNSIAAADLEQIAEKWRKILRGGALWLLIDSKAGLCSTSSISLGNIKTDPRLNEIRASWQISTENRLQYCPHGLFTLR